MPKELRWHLYERIYTCYLLTQWRRPSYARSKRRDPYKVSNAYLFLSWLSSREINAMFRSVPTAFVAIAAIFILVTAEGQARPLGGFSAGSRGMRTYSAPPSTATAPTAAPIQRSMTQSSGAGLAPTAPSAGLVGGRGLLGGLAAGVMGRVCLACYSGTDCSVAWRGSLQSSG